MAFTFPSIRSFKVKILLIFLSFLAFLAMLFVGFNEFDKEQQLLVHDLDTLKALQLKYNENTVAIRTNIVANQTKKKNLSQVFNKHIEDLDAYRTQLLSIKNLDKSGELQPYWIVLHDMADLIKAFAENLNTWQIYDDLNAANELHFYQVKLNNQFNPLIKSYTDDVELKAEHLKRYFIAIILLLVVLIFGVIYLLTSRLTKDLKRIISNIENKTPSSDELLESNIEEVSTINQSLRALKAKLREVEANLEESVKTCEYKSVFLANMSYEIRTPLNSALGMINMLKQSDLTPQQQIQLEIAEYSSEHVLQLANMILDNSKVDDNKIELELSTIDLKSDLSRLLRVFQYQAWDSDLEFEFKFLSDQNQKFLLFADIKRIKQILTNLMSNAIKFTNSGKVSLIIDQTVGPDDYQIVTFYVKDTGIGIAPEKAKRVLDDSEKNQLSILDYYGGTGLGLTVSSQLIKLMGGELKLESKENEGSIFYFSIQLKKTLNLEIDKLEPSPILLNKFDYKFTVLVAEDNKMNQKVIKFLLEEQGADCTFVKNGSDAVKLFKILNFDMIFMDIFMPEMDGYEATRLIKSSEKYSKRSVPIIAVSASAFEEDIKNAKAAGIDDFLAKPIESDKLKALLIKYTPK